MKNKKSANTDDLQDSEKDKQSLLIRLNNSQNWGVLKTTEPEEFDPELDILKHRLNRKKTPK